MRQPAISPNSQVWRSLEAIYVAGTADIQNQVKAILAELEPLTHALPSDHMAAARDLLAEQYDLAGSHAIAKDLRDGVTLDTPAIRAVAVALGMPQ